MKEFPVSVRAVGAGSQPVDDEELQYLAMPREMTTFRMPLVPDHVPVDSLMVARDVLAALLRDIEAWDPGSTASGPRLDLDGIGADALGIVNQMLGEGEVSIRIDGARACLIQESVFTGLWRVVVPGVAGVPAADWIEASPMPRIVGESARLAASARIGEVTFPANAMNSPALLAEVAAQMRSRRPHDAAHVVNLTLFPMTPEDHQVLESALPVGPVAIMSRGFGNCRITSTGARDVWRVQYFNNMNTLILNTIEVVAMPEVALAASEDLADTRTRLAELVDWMSESCTA